MLLKSVDGSTFELQILGYEFPHNEDDEYDSNWLIVRIVAKNAENTWETVEACMDTYGAQELYNWLDVIVNGSETHLQLKKGFLEHELNFELISSTSQHLSIRVRCRFHRVLKGYLYLIRTAFDYQLEREQLRQAAQVWLSEIQQFPTRKERK